MYKIDLFKEKAMTVSVPSRGAKEGDVRRGGRMTLSHKRTVRTFAPSSGIIEGALGEAMEENGQRSSGGLEIHLKGIEKLQKIHPIDHTPDHHLQALMLRGRPGHCEC